MDAQESLNLRPVDHTDALKNRFETWMSMVSAGHDGYLDVRNQVLNWTPLVKSVDKITVALVSTAGIHLRSQEPYDTLNPHGDSSYRKIPSGTRHRELMISHTHYNHADADEDINCIFPIERISQLRDEGRISKIVPVFYGMMGFNPDPTHLLAETAPAIGRELKEQGAELVILSGG